MHTNHTKTLSAISLRVIYALMILSMLLAVVWIKPASAAVSNPQAWTNVYHGTSSPATVAYTVNAGTNRMLVVAISSTRTTTGTQTASVTYGGQALTKQITDESTATYQHTWLFYLKDTSSVMNGAAQSLVVTISGGTARMTDVFATVFTGVDQSASPIRDSKNYTSSTGTTGTSFSFSPGLTVNIDDQAVEIINLSRIGSTTNRTITYATNWTMAAEQTSSNTDFIRNAVANRSIPTSNTIDPSTTYFSTTLANGSMSGMSIKPAMVTISGSVGVAGAGATINYSGGSTAADSSGNYSFAVLSGWTGTATPYKPGYTFSPVSKSYTSLTVDQTAQDYTATQITYTISGSTGTAGAGAIITYTGGSTTADGTTGDYSFTVSYNWSGTVTPSKANYTFAPASRTYSNVTDNQTSQNYTATIIPNTISGSVGVAGAGATITYTGGSTNADSSGNYSFAITSNWSGTVTPTKTGYTFTPPSKSYSNVTASETGQNYTATLNTYTISGNAGVAGATITYTGGSTTADSSGAYTFTVSYGWSGVVTPSLTGYTFSPTNRSYSSVAANQTAQNYTATQTTYTISGSTGTAGSGATITYTGGSTTASGTGAYSFTVVYGWSGTVTPSKTGYAFTPASRTYSNITANQTNQNYTAAVNTFTISGNAGVSTAIITYTGGSTTANSSGDYSFTVSSGWSGTVTPSKTGFSFVPASRTYTSVAANQTTQNFTARPTIFSFASMGDASAEAAYFTTAVNQVSTLNPALVIFNGDLEESGFVTSEIDPMIAALKAANLFNRTFLVRGNADDHVANSAALWESYFETAPNIKVLPAFVTNKVALDSSSDNLNYSFEYGNSIFIGLDVPGDIDNMTTAEKNFLDARLTYAESQGLTHAFIFFHGPEYPVESIHSLCSTRADANCTPPDLITIINNHPIVSATFHGHEQVLSWTHMDDTRVAGLTRSYEQFITSPAGGSSYNEYIYPERVDYYYPDMAGSQGFATISVDGLSFTYSIYKVGTTTPVWSHTFSKLNNAPTISDITNKTTNEDVATGAISFTVGDVETSIDYLTVTASSSNTNLVPNGNISLGGSGANRTLNITPAPNQSGTATITVSVNDGNVTTSDTFLLTVNPVNDAPVATPQSISMPWNTSIAITLAGTDVEGSPLTYSIVDSPAHGGLSGSGANQTYTPTPNYSGTDSFTFTVNDGTIDSAPATVSLNVTAYTISGNAGVAGATLSYIDGTAKTVTADGTGAYSFQVPTDWSGTVTPSKAGYNFSPASLTYANVLADQIGQNYSTTGVTFTISGNAGLAGVTLSYTDGTPKTTTSDGAGQYSIQVPYNWSGTVTPSLSGYGFRPAMRTYTNLTSNQVVKDYITTTARVYYVDKTNAACTDSGTVGSMAVPFCTITRGAYLATAGQIVHVLHGTYAETVYPNSGTAGNPVTFWADPGVTVTGQPGTASTNYSAFAVGSKSYVVIDGFNITNTSGQGMYVDSSNHITITNNHVSYSGASSLFHPYEQGIYLKGTTYSIISGNTTDHNTCIGIRLLNNSNNNLVSNNLSYSNFSVIETDAAGIETTGSSYNTIINNVTYSNEDSGINIYVNSSTGVQSTFNLVIGNLSYENGDHGIDVNNSPYNTFVGNTVHGNGTTGINVEGEASTGSHHTTIMNNISSGNGFTPPAGSFGGNLRVDSASIVGTTIDYNLFNRESATVQITWNDVSYISLAAFRAVVTGQEVHGLEGDPLFVAPVPSVLRATGVPYVGAGIFGNYYPKPGSPAIDSANSNAPSQPATDIDGNSRVDDPATPDTGAGLRTFDDRGAYEFLPLGASLPVVTTQAVTNITTTTATGNGNITATGEPNPTQHGVVWNTTGNPTTDDSKTTDGSVGTTGAFTSSMTGLVPGTLYHVRAYATNTMGTVYGEEVTFTALTPSTVTTQAVTNITTTTATGNGNITALGVPNPTQHGVVWSTSANPTTADSKTTDGAVSATGAFTSEITGLTAGTLYHVRAYVTNAAGTVYGGDVTFTAYHVPTVTTSAANAITTTTATGNGNITALGVPNPTQHGVVWSTSADPTIADSKTTDGAVGATGAFTSSMTGLIPGTLYHFRAYATNSAGTVYGDDFTFTTLLAPTVTTQAVTAITTTTATGNGNITVLGTFNPTEHGVVWATTANPTTANSKTTDGPVSATGSFTSSMTGLTPGTLYHVRAYATSAAGTSYGEDVSFTALIAPTVTTQAVTSIGTTNAIGNGNVTALGVPNPTQHGVVWSTSANPTLADSKTTDGDVALTGAFTSSITGLTPGMLYHVRAYATNVVGTSYGEDVTFTTLPSTTGTTTPATNPGTGSNVTETGTADWANPGYIVADDTNYASATLTGSILSSGYLEGTNYGFAIPADAVINGIVVTIGRHESGTRPDYLDVRDSTVKLLKAGVMTGNNKAATGTEWPTAAATPAIYGTTADLWGTTWTPAEINASNFGVALSVVSGVNRIAYVDYMQISVTYTVTMVGSNTTVNCGAGTPVVTYGSSITCVATVARGSGTKTPTGNVSWTTNGGGNFVTSPCALSGSGGTATCSVTYTPSIVGTGSHTITATYAGDPNFFTSNGNQIVTVNKKAASVTPNAASKVYGDPDPALTGTLTGFVPADGVSATYQRALGETVAGSPYAISATLSPTGALANYIITYNTANFAITAKLTTVILGNLNQTYDGTPKSVTVTTVPAGLTVDVTYNGLPTPPSALGSYAVVATITNPNYTGTANGTLVIAQATLTQSIPLVPGWNLISFKVHPENTDIATVLSSIQGNYNLVYAWNAASSSNNWLMYDPSMPPFLNSLNHLDETMGFWIHMTAADTLEVTGTVPLTTNISLHTGWNLVGYPSNANRSLPEALSINGCTNFSLVYAYDANAAAPWKLFDVNMPPFLNSLTELSPSWGYWVWVNADCTWTVTYLP